MPIHDWKKPPAGFFHHFHQQWTSAICNALNAGRLPKGFFAMIEQHAPDVVPDVLTLRQLQEGSDPPDPRGVVAVADAPPRTRFVATATEMEVYAAKANRIVVRHVQREIVAAIEVVSPGNKHSKSAIQQFVSKAVEFLKSGVHLLIIDLFPPTPREPQGIHKAIWDEIHDQPFELPPDKRLTLAAYTAGIPVMAYVEPVGVGDSLPDMPVFLDRDNYVRTPLEDTYAQTWNAAPAEFQEIVVATAD